ncbi:glycosyl hydrolase 53 family protein [Massilibacteroides sp.]|uniref:glycoside hydrolase family 53 protein n=1 Tax=Massilibacteroides sp. TaxID=2034766 RepID=UPI002612FB8E|nr:glycosyl hydrolase 53 family protein [Massilibacteroides sp.]MDD4515519.1 glycosyl hydrolase 53 family protein [Massilibacteroides sp.]
MKHMTYFTLFFSLAFALFACSNEGKTESQDDKSDDNDETTEIVFAKGADIGWMTEYEAKGYNFFNAAGEKRECTELMKELGLNAVRLRVWVNPEEHDNWCNKEDLLVKAKRAKALGMDIMVNFHYSDWWADPGKQNIPAAWKSYTYEQMKTAVANHTNEVLQLLEENQITPKWVQVGNETSNGFLWDMGQADKNPKQYAGLFSAGYDAVKKVFPEAIVIAHLDNGFSNGLYNWNLDILKNNGAKWDMIGMSLYPYWAMQNTSFSYTTADSVITDCTANIQKVSTKYNCDVMIVETGMECADASGNLATSAVLAEGKRQLDRILKECMENTDGRCKGVFYWEPECKPSQYRLGAFTEDGRPTVIMDAFK